MYQQLLTGKSVEHLPILDVRIYLAVAISCAVWLDYTSLHHSERLQAFWIRDPGLFQAEGAYHSIPE